MGSPSLTSDVKSAVNYIGAGIEKQSRALRSTVRFPKSPADVVDSSRTVTQELQMAPVQLLSWVAAAFAMSASFLRLETGDISPAAGRVVGDFVIVDKFITRC